VSSRPPPLPPPAPPPSRRPGESAPPTPSAPPKPPAKPEKPAKQDKPAERDKAAATPAQRAARNASYALLAFTLLTVLALAAWFASADQPWGFSSFVAVLSALLGTGATALLWRQPTRQHAIGGLAVMGLSLVRVGIPTMWTSYSVALITITALLAIPLVQAAIVLPRS
jgi:hypothetical protein